MEESSAKETAPARPAPNLAPSVSRPNVAIADVRRPAAAQNPVDGVSNAVHEAPKEDTADKPGTDKEVSKAAVVQDKAKKLPKEHQSGVGGAICATVVIVLGLAGLAVYAYLKSR